MSQKNELSKSDADVSRAIAEAAVKKITFLDGMKNMGEENDEIESYVTAAARETAAVFCYWLNVRGVEEGSEVLAAMAEHFIEFIYLGFEGRRPTLANFTNSQLSDFINLCEFVVPEREWNAMINPFDGARLFFEFLHEYAYPVKLESKCRALQQLRRTILKHPIPENLKTGLSEVQ